MPGRQADCVRLTKLVGPITTEELWKGVVRPVRLGVEGASEITVGLRRIDRRSLPGTRRSAEHDCAMLSEGCHQTFVLVGRGRTVGQTHSAAEPFAASCPPRTGYAGAAAGWRYRRPAAGSTRTCSRQWTRSRGPPCVIRTSGLKDCVSNTTPAPVGRLLG